MAVCRKSFTPKYTIRSRILLLGTLYFILFLFSLLQQPYLNLLLFCVANILFFIYRLKLPSHWHFSFPHTDCNYGNVRISSNRYHYEIISSFFRTDTLGLALYGIISKSIFFIIVYLATILLKPKDKQRENFDRSCLFLILIPISSIFVMFTFWQQEKLLPMFSDYSYDKHLCHPAFAKQSSGIWNPPV